MQQLKFIPAFLMAGALVGCQGDIAPPPTAAPEGVAKPFSTKVNDGIEHEFYRDVSVDAFLKQIPSGSIDSLDMNLDGGPQVIALVKVPESREMDLKKIRFETRFTTNDGQEISKQWAVSDKSVGKITALFCLPPSVVGGETKLAQNAE